MILVVPIVVFQLFIAAFASYSFSQFRGRIKEMIFFLYIILMLMPYQVTLVPNYLVAQWLHTLDNPLGDHSARHLCAIQRFHSHQIHAAYSGRHDRGGKARRRRALADIHADLHAALQKRAVFHHDSGVYRLLEHGGAAADPDDRDAEALHPLSVYLSKINSGEVGVAFAVATVYMVPAF